MSTDYAEPTDTETNPDPWDDSTPTPEVEPAAPETDDREPAETAHTDSPGRGATNPARTVLAAQRRAVDKTLQVLGADPAAVAATASLLGVSDPSNTSALVMACLSAGRPALRPILDVLAVAGEEDPFEAVDAAIALADKPERFKAAWDALARQTDIGRAPGNPAKAGTAFARAALKLKPAAKEALRLPELLIG